MTVYCIEYEYEMNRWTCVWNRNGFAKEFASREEAEEFIRTHESLIRGREYAIRELTYTEDTISEMEYGTEGNEWLGEVKEDDE